MTDGDDELLEGELLDDDELDELDDELLLDVDGRLYPLES